MSTFIWRGKNHLGQVKQGEITALNIRFARVQLQAQGLFITKIAKKNLTSSLLFRSQQVTAQDIRLMLRQLAVLINAGIPLSLALNSISTSNEKHAMQNLLTAINHDLQQGNSLASCLQKYPQHFAPMTTQLIAAGEISGKLGIMLTRVADYHEKSHALKSKVIKTLLYPAAVITMAMVVTIVLMVVIVPQFTALFAGFNAPLPLATQIVVNISTIMQKFWWIIAILMMLLFIAFKMIKRRSTKFLIYCDAVKLNIPIFGKILRYSTLARIARTLATNYSTGVSLLDALLSVRYLANNLLFQQALAKTYQAVQNGQSLCQALYITNLFPSMMLQMVNVGEETGKLDIMLEKIADLYEAEVTQIADQLNQLLEPFIMVILGVIIGGIVIAMYLPIFKLGMVI